ncbi:zinc finger and BTB domain-containing protein 41-like [Mercenaria mercenaria]|uniref:zinc finger and BTB domain-containing protein 41-like n=1 Tax=Mercenaria mercenaria TaxID=6596 RepID=UPI00234EC3F0|nr:zinc finger and BTB domain-containing protein 41-like [Mercenaria mercenaria]
MENTEEPDNDVYSVDKEDEQIVAEQDTGTENDTSDHRSDFSDTDHEKDSNTMVNKNISEFIVVENETFKSYDETDAEGKACAEKDLIHSPDGCSEEEKAVRRRTISVHELDYTSPSSQADQIIDLRTNECVKRGTNSCIDVAKPNEVHKISDGVTYWKYSSSQEFPATRNQAEESDHGSLLPSGSKPSIDIENEPVVDTENALEVKPKAVRSIQDFTDAQQEVAVNEEISEISVYDSCEGKVSHDMTDDKYENEAPTHSEDPKITVKQENVAEEFTAIRRPKRKRSSQVNYDESELWDSESLFEITATDNMKTTQTRQSRKLKSSKKSNERIRIIHNDSHFEEMFKNLHKLQKVGKYCDVKICAIDGSVLAHSVVIIAASPLLHKKYKQKVKTVTDINSVTDLDFKEVPLWALEKIVTFLYTGSVEVSEKDTKHFSKHCKALGLNDLHKKLNSEPCSIDLETVTVLLSEEKEKRSVEKSTNNTKGASKLKTDFDSVDEKSRKRKIKTVKSSGTKAKVSKQNLSVNEATTEEENNVIVKVETSENTFEVVKKDNTLEDSAKTETVYSSDFEDEMNDDADDEWKVGIDDSGEDTDSYFEKQNFNKKSKLKRKGAKLKAKKKIVKKEKKKKENKVRSKEKTCKSNDKIVAESENKVEENHSLSVETVVDESIREADYNQVNSDKNKEKLPLDIGTGNGGECDKCGKSFYFQYELTGHRNKCTGKNNRQRRKCVTCHVNFESTEEYMDHRNNDERCIALRQEKLIIRKQKRFEMRRKYCCCACPRKFRRLADQIEHEFLAHEIQYDKEKWPDLYCEYCNYWSMNPWKLHHHKLVSCNKGQEPICDMCGNSYKNEKTLKKHKELMHTDVQPMLTCEECGKSLKGPKGLKHHIRLRHRGENLHNLMMCHICSQTYRTSSDLTFHLYKVHEQPLPEGFTVYRCPRCDYCHNNKRFFDKHMFLHEDKREWHCEICSKAFKTKNSLSTHMIVHTSSRIPCPFDDCTYKALKNCHLKNHIENQHTQKGEKHEKCHLCEYSTFFRGNLIKHQRSVHKLEVVTRHSVEMKAKYKNLKSGQIVGVESNIRNEKKNSRSRSGNSEYHASQIEMGSAQETGYPASSSSDNSIVENQRHFLEKAAPMPSSQNVADSFVYTLVNAPMMSHHSNFPANANMYRIPPIDFSVYNQNSSMDQM